ncbi:MAG: ATP-grasp domain-containing protein [Alphaproteobacteria bacterium]|nr:ATP-grasp domain-containing protein [Alphaproteobacteria bacterium]
MSNHSPYVYSRHFVIKDIQDPEWLNDINEIITKYNIDFIFPGHVFIIDKIIEQRQNIKCRILLPDNETVKIIRSKTLTLKLLENIINTPKIYNTPKDVEHYPVFVKPDNWYGQQNTLVIKDEQSLLNVINDTEIKYIIQEYLPGEEYTIDCLSDKSGNLLFCSGRKRNRIRMGTSMNCTLVDEKLNSYFIETAKHILKNLKIYGVWFFQMKKDISGTLKLLEIETRVAGTMALNRVRGINFPLLTIFIHNNLDIQVLLNNYNVVIDRALQNRYLLDLQYNEVYIDLDHTIITKDGKINTQIIAFLYQCINKKIKITLISKSLALDKMQFLRDHKISEIFDRIIWLKEHESKANFITNTDSLFIDDSFSQRREVAIKHNIPTFDPSMIESLIDEKY